MDDDKVSSLEEARRRAQAEQSGDPDMHLRIVFPDSVVEHKIDLRLPGLLTCLVAGFIGGAVAFSILI
ncbi:hypothetical protein LCM28_09870 [Salipiger pacificus]|nr:hypothetical protein [Alloyangia pacifica]